MMKNDGAGTRTERDSMGEMQVPQHALYGASTHRAVLNFPISGLRLPRRFIRALGLIKLAAAQTNAELGLVDKAAAEHIAAAARDVADGKLDDHFPLDVFQTGSGTSTNMNANEVIAHHANRSGGEHKVKIHPNDHVNFGQSSNDVIPTAVHISAAVAINEALIPALETLKASLERKSKEFWGIIKTGRTHLQDATPIRLGQEFSGYAGQIERGIARARYAIDELSEVALGGTAVGTGINTHPEFARRATARLAELTGLPIHETNNHFQAQASLDNAVAASGMLKVIAVSLTKIANDIRWLASGPRAGIGELELPAVQPGSSIMPGKVNPVISESVLMVCAQVIGNDATITVGGQSGNFEINLTMPLVGYDLLQTIELLAAASRNLATQAVDGLKATSRGPEMVERGLAIGTALAPIIGYDAAAAIAKEAASTGKTVREIAREKTKLSDAELDKILDPALMVEPSADRVGAGGG
ncbi:MAG: class II fumarate hydratase [Candidatus Eremiobacteraeota bacterium]|nr:class II fumarate hydratase [Candidatus Eremiobacteraeota bacterium]MBV8203526.1 class II fumarate hydratase [Candidatus Eremiobacteraeota bacterium]MBV8340262.1 class II fumarate hydratase [Candidatus Eremiobacteraeota bacterium]MBV8461614.1 class II fumarate hydratase [Candidatus Eremiobacteraeota bacterium]MBV8596551.1 class II fumarate hydratase [Candidatus Eremiobacteraeota bacterium]